MIKQEIDSLIQNICFDYFHKTVKNCIEEWGIDLKGKDKHLMYPTMPEFPDTQEEIIKVVKQTYKTKERLKIRAKEFRDTLNEYYHKNPKKYSVGMYKDFFDYWGIPENKVRPKKLVFENEKSWNLSKRLITWFGNTKQGKEEEPVRTPRLVKPINMEVD